MKMYCPECRDRRKDKRDKSVSVNLTQGIAYCHYCGETFRAKGYGRDVELTPIGKHEGSTLTARGEALPPPRPTGTPPRAGGEWAAQHIVNSTEIPSVFKYFFAERKISEETLKNAGISVAEVYMPQTRRKEWCVCFNYFEEGRLVNVKFRDLNKNFKMTTGAEVIPYHIDPIRETPECIITEGEIDALSFMEIGRSDVISVPAGANKNLTWLDRFMDTHFEDKRVIYIAVDTDRKGQELCRELLKRLGAERCRVVSYPEDCKDANEVLVKYGKEALTQTLANAPETPLEGVYTASNVSKGLRTLFERGMERGAETGWENFDKFCTFELGRLCVVTCIPGAGKSEFVDELVIRLNLRHKWKAAFFNKCDFGLTVERDREAKLTRVHIQKVKFRHLGNTGNVAFLYNIINGRLSPYEERQGVTAEATYNVPKLFDNEEWVL